jgi:hypothetical protein
LCPDKVREDNALHYELLFHLLDLDDSSATPLRRRSDEPHKRRGDSSSSSSTTAAYPLALYEEFLDLMCEREPSRVVHYLRAHASPDQPASYRPEVVLATCRRQGLLDAQVHLLETAGQYGEAFSLLSGDVKSRVNKYLESLEAEQEENKGDVKLSGVEAGLLVVVQYCQRVSRYTFALSSVDQCINTLDPDQMNADPQP